MLSWIWSDNKDQIVSLQTTIYIPVDKCAENRKSQLQSYPCGENMRKTEKSDPFKCFLEELD